MTKVQRYGSSDNPRRYITRYTEEAFNFAVKFGGEISTHETPIGLVYHITI